MAIGEFEAVGDRGNRLMLQLCEGVGLAREIFVGLDSLRLVDKVIDHLFDRARTIREPLVGREVHHAHSAAAKQPRDFITPLQNGAGFERAGLLRCVFGRSCHYLIIGGAAFAPSLHTLQSLKCCRYHRRHSPRRSIHAPRRRDPHCARGCRESQDPSRARSARRCIAAACLHASA